jgi:hypothetical protein
MGPDDLNVKLNFNVKHTLENEIALMHNGLRNLLSVESPKGYIRCTLY